VLAIFPHPWMLAGWLSLGAMSPSSPGAQASREAGRRGLLAAGVGALTGLAGLTRPVLLPVYGLLSGLLVVRHVTSRRWKDAALVLAAGLVTLLVLTPWTIRNYRVHGRLLAVKDNFGKEFWMGNNPHATGTSFAEGGEVEITIQYPPKALSLAGKVPEIQIMDAFEAEALDYVRSDRVAFVERTAQKALWFWTYAPPSVARSYGRFTTLVRLAHDGGWILLLALAVLGVLIGGAPREYLTVLGLYLAVYSLAYGLTHVGQPRMRAEAEFIFLPAMGAGAAFLLATVLPRAHHALATALPAASHD
jgi:4-amino-4-deoxy-L-arabinose transferase-like glycosyltransferase